MLACSSLIKATVALTLKALDLAQANPYAGSIFLNGCSDTRASALGSKNRPCAMSQASAGYLKCSSRT